MTLEEARAPGNLLLECVAGSHAYGTNIPQSDTDLRGIFVAPRSVFFGLEKVEQVSDAKNDETYYEIGRFVELLAKNNPNILELLYAPEDTIRHRDPLLDLIRPERVLSRLCEQTFAGYAVTQIRNARGLNKKIVNPVPEKRSEPIDFCHVIAGQGAIPLSEWLTERGINTERCGLINVPHMPGVHAIFHDPTGTIAYRGMFAGENPTDLRLSSIPKGEEPIGWLQFNADAFKRHCREHKEYWAWVANRNESRYETNIAHGKNYDSKNLMHTIRLLSMAEEIAREGVVRVRRPDADFLLKVRQGEFDYDELITMAEEKLAIITDLFARSDLPEKPDRKALETTLVDIRERHYAKV